MKKTSLQKSINLCSTMVGALSAAQALLPEQQTEIDSLIHEFSNFRYDQGILRRAKVIIDQAQKRQAVWQKKTIEQYLKLEERLNELTKESLADKENFEHSRAKESEYVHNLYNQLKLKKTKKTLQR